MQEQGRRLSELCSQLTNHTERWIAELRVHGIRPTLGYGMILKCSALVEQIVRRCCQVFLRVTEEQGLTVLKRIHPTALVEKLNLGQLERFLKSVVPVLKDRGVLDQLEDQTLAQFDAVRQTRNAFVHGTEVHEDASAWIAYLEASSALCRTQLMHVAMEIEAREAKR
jgi:hypothetical protein